MYCRKCGSQIDDSVAFCPKCGTKVVAAEDAGTQSENTGSTQNIGNTQSTPNVGTYASAAKNYASTAKTRVMGMTIDKAVAVIATFFMLLIMVVPFTVFAFYSRSFTLFGTFDVTYLTVYGGGWKALFIIAYIAVILAFAFGKFFGKTRSLCLLGCVGSWILFVLAIIEVAVTNGAVHYNVLILGFGFYVWIVANILQIIAVCMDKRK